MSIGEMLETTPDARRQYAREILDELSKESIDAHAASRSGWRRFVYSDRRYGWRRFFRLTPGYYDAYWYRAQYGLAADSLHRQLEAWLDRQPPKADSGRDAELRAIELVLTIEQDLGVWPRGKEDQYFYHFLEDIEASTLLLWAGAITLREEAVANMSSSEAIPRSLKKVRRLLERRLEEGTLRPTTVVRVALDRLSLSARSRYNLACYYAQAAMIAGERHQNDIREDYSLRAIVQLDLAAPGFSAALRAWAPRDPSFRRLAAGKYKKDFEQALAHSAPAAAKR